MGKNKGPGTSMGAFWQERLAASSRRQSLGCDHSLCDSDAAIASLVEEKGLVVFLREEYNKKG